LLLAKDLSLYQEFLRGEKETPGSLVLPEEAERPALQGLLFLVESFARFFARKKQALEVLDFNDLEELSLKALEKEDVRRFYQERLGLLLVDEFQDTNSVQREILARVARPGWGNLFVVGDA